MRRHVQVKEPVLEALAGTEVGTARVDKCITENIARAYAVVAQRQTEQQRREAGLLLRAVSAPRTHQGDSKHGMESLIAARLGEFIGDGTPLRTGSHWRSSDKTLTNEYALTAAGKARSFFNVRAVEAARPKEELAPGDTVLCRGSLATLASFEEATGRCEVTFSREGFSETVPYASRFHVKGLENKGCARLQRPQPSLMPPPKTKRRDAISDETRAHVRAVYELTCPTSPHTKDIRRRHLAVHVVQVCCFARCGSSQVRALLPLLVCANILVLTAHILVSLSCQEVNALIQTLTLREIYEVFKKTYPLETTLSYPSFKKLKPWNLIKAYRETCLCRLCELFRLYMEGLHEVAKVLAPLLEVRWPALPAVSPFTVHLLLPPPPSPRCRPRLAALCL